MDIHLRNVPDRTHKALPIVAAAYNLRSVNSLILASLDAMLATVCERDPLVAAQIKFAAEDPALPETVDA